MTRVTPVPATTPGAAVFELERFEWTAEGRLEVAGRWSVLRARRFVRPTLTLRGDGGTYRLLALLEHKPWAAEEGELWVAAFPWEGEPLAFEGANLAVASGIELELPPPGAAAVGAFHAVQPAVEKPVLPPEERASRERAHALELLKERDDALEARDAALEARDAATAALAGAEAELAAALAEQERLREERDTAAAERDLAVAERDLAESARERAVARVAEAEERAARAEAAVPGPEFADRAVAAEARPTEPVAAEPAVAAPPAGAAPPAADPPKTSEVDPAQAPDTTEDPVRLDAPASEPGLRPVPLRPPSPISPGEIKMSPLALWAPRLVAIGIFVVLVIALFVLLGS